MSDAVEEQTLALSRAPSHVDKNISNDQVNEKRNSKFSEDTDVEAHANVKEVEQPAAQEEVFPEGGLRGWGTVMGAFFVQACGFGYTSSFGVYQDYYVRVYIPSQSSSTISWIGSVNAFLVVSGGLVAGRLFDKGYFRLATLLGSFLSVFGLFILSLAEHDQFYQVFLAQGVCMGIGAGLLYVPSIAVVSHYFRRRRVLAMAILATGSSFGSVIHPIMLNNTLYTSLGFGNSVRASAGLVTGMLAIANLLMKPRLPPPKDTIDLIPACKKFIRDRSFVCATIGMFLVTIGFYYPLYFLQLDAAQHGLSETFAFYSLVILNFCSLVGRLSSGFVAHYLGAPLVITISAACVGVVTITMLAVQSVASVVLIGIFFGFFTGSYIGLNGALLAVLSETPGEMGARMGLAFAVSAFGSLIGSPICGALLGDDYQWWKPSIFSGIIALAGAAVLVMMCLEQRRRGRLLPHHT